MVILQLLEEDGYVEEPSVNREGDGEANGNMGTTQGQTLRQITYDQYRMIRLQGLCFKCGEQFSRGHHCKNPDGKVLLREDEAENVQGITQTPENGGWTETRNDNQQTNESHLEDKVHFDPGGIVRTSNYAGMI